MDPSQVDTQDGEKIVGHVFGGQQDQVANRLPGTANLGGVGGDLVRKLLPILAPIVMSYLAKKVLGGGQDSGAQGSLPSPAGGGADLGSVLGGGSQPQQAQLREQDQEPPTPCGNEPNTADAGQTNDSAPPEHRSVTPGELIEVDLPDEDR